MVRSINIFNTYGENAMSRLYQNLLKLEKEENLKLKKIIKELKSDIELYKIRLKNSKETNCKAPDNKNQEQSITIQQLNIYC